MEDNLNDLLEEIISRMRPSTGIKSLDYDLDAADEIATMENYEISTTPDMSERLKTFSSWMLGIYHNFRVARVCLEYNLKEKAEEARLEAEECLKKGKKICEEKFDKSTGENLTSAMDLYFKSLERNYSQSDSIKNSQN